MIKKKKKKKLYQPFHECNQPSDAWNFSKFSFFGNSSTFSWIIFPWIGIFSNLCIRSQLKQAKLTCTYIPSFICCLLVSPLLLNTATILPLFFFHIDNVFFGTLNFLQRSLLATPHSIFINAAYLTSKALLISYNTCHSLQQESHFISTKTIFCSLFSIFYKFNFHWKTLMKWNVIAFLLEIEKNKQVE